VAKSLCAVSLFVQESSKPAGSKRILVSSRRMDETDTPDIKVVVKLFDLFNLFKKLYKKDSASVHELCSAYGGCGRCRHNQKNFGDVMLFKYFYKNLNNVNLFSISELQQFSGIKAHTIRVWEQRYDALQPDRSEGNTRYYNGKQLRRLLNIVSLVDADHKVSELCKMPDNKLHRLLDAKLSSTTVSDHSHEYFISQIIASAMEFDEAQFDKFFSGAVLRLGLKETYRFILYPALTRLGLLWAQDSLRPAHEHFITSLFRQKILSAIDALPLPAPAKVKWLLFLPEDELHETGLLFANFLIRQAGHKVIYLGTNVPFETLEDAVGKTRPNAFLFFLVRKNDKKNDQDLVSQLSRQFPDKKIYLACEPSRIDGVKRSKNVFALHNVEDLEKALK